MLGCFQAAPSKVYEELRFLPELYEEIQLILGQESKEKKNEIEARSSVQVSLKVREYLPLEHICAFCLYFQ